MFHLRQQHSNVIGPSSTDSNTTARVQVEHTELKKHYNTLNGYCDHHESIPPHTQFEEVCVRVCDAALLWQKFHLTCVSVCECVFVCINFISYWHGGVVGEALPASLVKLFSVVCSGESCLTDKLMALMQCTASFFHFQSI